MAIGPVPEFATKVSDSIIRLVTRTPFTSSIENGLEARLGGAGVGYSASYSYGAPRNAIYAGLGFNPSLQSQVSYGNVPGYFGPQRPAANDNMPGEYGKNVVDMRDYRKKPMYAVNAVAYDPKRKEGKASSGKGTAVIDYLVLPKAGQEGSYQSAIKQDKTPIAKKDDGLKDTYFKSPVQKYSLRARYRAGNYIDLTRAYMAGASGRGSGFGGQAMPERPSSDAIAAGKGFYTVRDSDIDAKNTMIPLVKSPVTVQVTDVGYKVSVSILPQEADRNFSIGNQIASSPSNVEKRLMERLDAWGFDLKEGDKPALMASPKKEGEGNYTLPPQKNAA